MQDERQNQISVNLFDSEMFEWTQRPCSPELFSSPSKMQVLKAFKPHDIHTQLRIIRIAYLLKF